jgi:thymidine phosphorylase
LKVSINSSTDYNAAFRIISFDGRELMRRMINLQKGDNIVVLNDLGNLPKGSYILEVTTEGNKYVKRIIKN